MYGFGLCACGACWFVASFAAPGWSAGGASLPERAWILQKGKSLRRDAKALALVGKCIGNSSVGKNIAQTEINLLSLSESK